MGGISLTTRTVRRKDRSTRQRALILAAHGAGDGSQANARVCGLAEHLAASTSYDRVMVAFHKGTPTYREAVDHLVECDITIVPLMTSVGHFRHMVLPRCLAGSEGASADSICITDSVGQHPGLVGVLATRVGVLLRRFGCGRSDTVVVVVGHGTRRRRTSRGTTVRLARRLRARLDGPAVRFAFLDEAPRLEQLSERISAKTLLVIPFLIGGGAHALRDVPARLGLGASASRPAPTVASVVNGRFIICDRPVGMDPAMVDIVRDLAGEAVQTTTAGSVDQTGSTVARGARASTRCGYERRLPRGLENCSDHDGPNQRRLTDDFGAAAPGVAVSGVASSGVAVRRGPAVHVRTSVLRLGTRASRLALWQARYVAGLLEGVGVAVDVVAMRTSGDCDLARPIDDLPSAAPFTDSIETSLRDGSVDLAVHSLKDLPVDGPPDLVIAAMPARGSAGEALVARNGQRLADLPPGSRIGTSSPRRRAQILAVRPDLVPVPIRGPVDDRVRMIHRGEMDAAVLAVAGLTRLGLERAITEVLPVGMFVPAPGQATLAVQTRRDDARLLTCLAAIDHAATRAAATAELEFLRCVEANAGSRRPPIVAAYAQSIQDCRDSGRGDAVARSKPGCEWGTPVAHASPADRVVAEMASDHGTGLVGRSHHVVPATIRLLARVLDADGGGGWSGTCEGQNPMDLGRRTAACAIRAVRLMEDRQS